jgi:hypothetical protein
MWNVGTVENDGSQSWDGDLHCPTQDGSGARAATELRQRFAPQSRVDGERLDRSEQRQDNCRRTVWHVRVQADKAVGQVDDVGEPSWRDRQLDYPFDELPQLSAPMEPAKSRARWRSEM